MLSAVKPTIIMLILGKINQISVCLAVALRLKLIWKKIVINHLVNSPFKVEVVSVLHPEVQVTKKKNKKKQKKHKNTKTQKQKLKNKKPHNEQKPENLTKKTTKTQKPITTKRTKRTK